MTKKEKQLLLKDLCARLPYGVKGIITYDESNITFTVEGIDNNILHLSDAEECYVEDFKPYLRPMSSMTEEEKQECCSIFNGSMYQFEVNEYGDVESTKPTVERECIYYDAELMAEWMNWLNAHHFDYRNLIEKGLAIEVTEENNPYG